MTSELLLLLLIAVFFLLIGLAFIALTAYQAYRRGYNPIVWGLAAIIALNPIFLLVVLAFAPHRSRVRMRDQFTAELDAKLANRSWSPHASRPVRVDAAAPTASVVPDHRAVQRVNDLSVTRSTEESPKDA